jgi:hypothetical protein
MKNLPFAVDVKIINSTCEIPQLTIRCTYEEALLYCFDQDIDGKNGWRLLTYAEQQNIRSSLFIYSEQIWYYNRTDQTICTLIPVRTKDEQFI